MNLSTLDTQRVPKVDARPARTHLAVGRRDTMRIREHDSQKFPTKSRPGPRRPITEWSEKSKRRFRLSVRNGDKDPQFMLTLTYSQKARPATHEAARGHLRAMLARLRRAGNSGWWVQHFQENGSIHYHLLLVDETSQATAIASWAVITGQSKRRLQVSLKEITNLKGLIGYLKQPQPLQNLPLNWRQGAYWGVFGHAKFVAKLRLEGEVAIKANRVLKQIAASKGYAANDDGVRSANMYEVGTETTPSILRLAEAA